MTTNQLLTQAAVIAGGIAALGFAGLHVGGQITLNPDWEADLWPRLQYMMVATVLIERTVEIYLNASSLNGDDRFTTSDSDRRRDAARPATVASTLLGLLTALSGVRLMATLGAPPPDAGLMSKIVWTGVDVALSGGLMAGGSALFHEAAEALRGGLKTLGEKFGPAP